MVQPIGQEEETLELPSWWSDVHKVVVLHKSVTVSVTRLREGDYDLGDIDIAEVTGVRFEQDDELPLDIAAECWSAFNDRLAAYDEDDERLDTRSRAEGRHFPYRG